MENAENFPQPHKNGRCPRESKVLLQSFSQQVTRGNTHRWQKLLPKMVHLEEGRLVILFESFWHPPLTSILQHDTKCRFTSARASLLQHHKAPIWAKDGGAAAGV